MCISRDQRNKRKFVTVVSGLETFGTHPCPFLQLPTSDKGRRSADIKLQDASKQFSRKLSCGASITKNAVGKKQIDVQGDFVHEVRLSKCGCVSESNENVEPAGAGPHQNQLSSGA